MDSCPLTCGVPYFQIGNLNSINIQATGELNDLDTWVYNFHTILKNKLYLEEDLCGFKLQDVAHAVAGLFLATLPAMDKETVYSAIASQNNFCVVCYASTRDALAYINRHYCPKVNIGGEKLNAELLETFTHLLNNPTEINEVNSVPGSVELDTDSDSENEFKLVYPSEVSETSNESITQDDSVPKSGEISHQSSKSDRSSCSESDDELETILLDGYKTFIGSSIRRKLNLLKTIGSSPTDTLDLESLGSQLSAENHIAAACCFRVRFKDNKQRIIHVTLLGVRRFWRRKKIGTSIIKLLKNPEIVGPYDAIVVHADPEAEGFFENLGFSADIVLNSMWSEFASEYTNCKLMTYLPAFTTDRILLAHRFPVDNGKELSKMVGTRQFDIFFKQWSSNAENAYISQVTLLRRAREEMLWLQETVDCQAKRINDLHKELRAAYMKLLQQITPHIDGDDNYTIPMSPTQMRKRLEEINHLIASSVPVQITPVDLRKSTHGHFRTPIGNGDGGSEKYSELQKDDEDGLDSEEIADTPDVDILLEDKSQDTKFLDDSKMPNSKEAPF
ncbi:hypothetical protein CRM22_010813 [Opisthorchis felineus]|uniref:N-acetyltransferase domain-containing protein n=1 Tax=Opisthorchis felineus TaxID=147828 RepID=A0A4S2KR71_OPIFE|nr:hypothetical protein CRM22_010813 [Opisthorchis felineus]